MFFLNSFILIVYGELYLWGRAFSGRLNYNLPLKLPTHLKFSQVALGWNHALVLTGMHTLELHAAI